MHIDRYGKITRAEYEKLCLVSARTANRELGVLFKKNLVEKKSKGLETYYVLVRFGKRKEKVIKSFYSSYLRKEVSFFYLAFVTKFCPNY